MWFIYALLGAFGKSYSGFFRKRLADNISASMFMWVSYLGILLLLAPLVLINGSPVFDSLRESPLVLIGSSVALMVATLLNLEALKREELSYIAPLNAFVPVFTVLLAVAILSEVPPLGGFIGIAGIFIGAYVINLKPGKVAWHEPIRHLFTNTGALLSLGVALLYAINTVLFKAALNRGYDEITVMYSITLIGWLLLFFVPIKDPTGLKSSLKANKVYLAGAVLSSLAGSLLHILALAGTYASYAVSIRRFDSVISVLLGWRYLEESNIRNKLIGSACMVAGAVVMAISR